MTAFYRVHKATRQGATLLFLLVATAGYQHAAPSLANARETDSLVEDAQTKGPRELVESFFSAVKRSDQSTIANDVARLQSALLSRFHLKKEVPDSQTRRSLAERVIRLESEYSFTEAEARQFKYQAVKLLGSFGDDFISRSYVFTALESGDRELQDGAIRGLSFKSSGIPADERWSKAEQLFSQGKLSQSLRLFLFYHLDRARFNNVAIHIVETTTTSAEFVTAATLLQDSADAELLKRIFVAAQKWNFKGNELNWVSDRKLAKFILSAENRDLPMALKFAIEGLCNDRFCLAPIQQRKLIEIADETVQGLAIEYMTIAFSMGSFSHDDALAEFNAQLAREKSVAIQQKLRTGIVRVEEDRKRKVRIRRHSEAVEDGTDAR